MARMKPLFDRTTVIGSFSIRATAMSSSIVRFGASANIVRRRPSLVFFE